jgi:hypothetical protein
LALGFKGLGNVFGFLSLKTMGLLYLFSCPACQFKAQVSGGLDYGMMAATQTIACGNCRRLYDAYVGKAERTSPEHVEAAELKCPKGSRHQVEVWNHPGPCPRCGETLVRADDASVCWD